MIRNYLLVAIRHFFRHKGFSIINLTGLSVGLASFLFLFLYIQEELSYDKFHKNLGQIHRVCHWQHYSNTDFACTVSPFPMASHIKETYPEITHATTYLRLGSQLISHKEIAHNQQLVGVNADFFKIFSLQNIQGDTTDLFSSPNHVVISESLASLLFPSGNALGNTLQINKDITYIVKGIFKKYPNNSTLQFDLLAPIKSLTTFQLSLDYWGNNWPITYVKTRQGLNLESFNKKVVHYLDDAREKDQYATEVFLFPFEKEHYYHPDGRPTNMARIRMFAIIAFFVLLLACINYINLATAQSAIRAKEVGLRKVAGARKKHLIAQFLGESFLMTFLALNFALILVRLMLPQFNNLANTDIALSYSDTTFIIGLVTIWLVTGLLAGLYPAFILSQQLLTTVIKHNDKSKSGSNFRVALVIIQFSLSIVLIISTITVFRQTQYMINKDLGYEKDQLVIVNVTDQMRDHTQNIRDVLLQDPDIKSCCFSSHVVSEIYSNGGGWNWEGKDPSVDPLVTNLYIDHQFIPTHGIKLAKGRNFTSIQSDRHKEGEKYQHVIINETFAKIIGKSEPSEIIIRHDGNSETEYHVVGITKDFHFFKAGRSIDPIIISMAYPNVLNYSTIKIDKKNVLGAMDHIKNTMAQFNPDYPFSYQFLDDRYDRQYRSEKRTEKILKAFTFLAIFISCLGLFGLASFTAQRKTKEIGIRKSLGASTHGVVWMLSRQFSIWVLLANILSWPLAYYAMNKFLGAYANRIDLSLDIFLISGLITWLLALGTIYYKTFIAASRNPAHSLRYE